LINANCQKGHCELDEVIAEEIRKMYVVDFDNEDKTELLEVKSRAEIWCRDKKIIATMFRNWLQEAKTKACALVVRGLFVSCTKCFVTTGIHLPTVKSHSFRPNCPTILQFT